MKPILFNTDMVRGLLDNRKTATRRVVKGYALEHLELDTDGSIIGVYNQFEGRVFPVMYYAPYHPGDILWVRETWSPVHVFPKRYLYKADADSGVGEGVGLPIKWHPSIHMPREAARIFLRVTDVRVERLQDIDDDGVVAEGLKIGAPFDELWDSTKNPPTAPFMDGTPTPGSGSLSLSGSAGRRVTVDKKILDVTCGARTIWFDKHHPAAVYCDQRREEYHRLWKNAENCSLNIDPDVLCDFTALPFPDDTFPLVVFDPPHLTGAKETSWLVKKYGKLDENWPKMLHDGFAECMRVLKPDGVLIFKWSEYDIPAEKVWRAIGQKPLFGHHSGKKSSTFWGCFMKLPELSEDELNLDTGEEGKK